MWIIGLSLHMRWERLFANIEAQEAAEALRAQEDSIAEMTRLLASEETLQERLLRRLGQDIGVKISGREALLRLSLAAVGKEWLSGREAGREVVLPLRHVIAIEPDLAQAERRAVDTRVLAVGFRSVLRELARQRMRVEVEMSAGRASFGGTIDQVGMDHCELVQHAADEFRRRKTISTVVWLPIEQMTAVYAWR